MKIRFYNELVMDRYDLELFASDINLPVSFRSSIDFHLESYSRCFTEDELKLISELMQSKDRDNYLIVYSLIAAKEDV